MSSPFHSLHGLSLVLALSALSACAAPARPAPVNAAAAQPTQKHPCKCEIAQALDAFHSAAARADEEAYFAAFAPEAIFLGTDASERWGVAAFRAYAHPHFAAGKGWKYVARGRNVTFSADGSVAWFDELLDNEKYGELRGSGVLVKREKAWKIVQYNLAFTVPNSVAPEFVGLRQNAPPAP
jgi:ketosteroid isomerase-like protein